VVSVLSAIQRATGEPVNGVVLVTVNSQKCLSTRATVECFHSKLQLPDIGSVLARGGVLQSAWSPNRDPQRLEFLLQAECVAES